MDSVLSDLGSYPRRGRALERTVVGGALVFGSVLVIPALVLIGYCVRVAETTLAGSDDPPEIAPGTWRPLAVTGTAASVILLVYLVGPLALGTMLGLVVGALGYYGLLGLAPVVADHDTLVWGTSVVAALVAALLALAFVAFTLVVYYHLPAALARYAETGSLRAAFERKPLVRIATTSEYALGMAALQLVPLVVPIVAVLCLVSIVGIVVLPAVPFVAALVSSRLIAVAVARSRSADEPSNVSVTRSRGRV
ncbi:DUF4013 domain-containing protein [Natrarchaeobius halalkaliphilus]|uniref:DUF4013 domain-containing protein n=1 Tax=Natrarchaeobius halalkaliphilus TaxID=1679091 RepID=A0A3N6LV07_9EURY|nr:DUF4013 domain-containing protein [Natrarchaeobius halalkaliphilus]RQG91464.1 DUF4013 domain-containing protein [Natrarchaeobius halalkaliphilus]